PLSLHDALPICHGGDGCGKGSVGAECPSANGVDELGGTWYWLRSPEEEKRITMGLYNRYCIRCHGVDGRGVWDIPGVPNFTDMVWQASRSDAQIARIIVEGRGAVMPQFRGTLSLEEAWAMARYLRTFVPGTEVSRPEPSQPARGAMTTAPVPRSEPTVAQPAQPQIIVRPSKQEAF